MKPEIAKIWVEALRSGEYEQCTSVLRSTDNKFCCLGVLCELAVKEGVIGPPEINNQTSYYIYDKVNNGGSVTYLKRGIYPPYEVTYWAGLHNRYGEYCNTSLAEHNDNGMTFDQIADIIEANVEKL